MGKWSGEGIPPTRKRLHRLREERRREQAALDKMQRAMDREFDRQVRRMRLDRMLVEKDAA